MDTTSRGILYKFSGIRKSLTMGETSEVNKQNKRKHINAILCLLLSNFAIANVKGTARCYRFFHLTSPYRSIRHLPFLLHVFFPSCHIASIGYQLSVIEKKSQIPNSLSMYYLMPYFAMILANSVLFAKPFMTLSLDVPVLSLFIQSLYPP